MKIQIIRYMNGYAIKMKRYFFWETIRYGDFFPSHLPEQEGKIIQFDSIAELISWLKALLPFSKIIIVSKPKEVTD